MNIFYTGNNMDETMIDHDLKLTIELYMKQQMEYLFTRTINVEMTNAAGDIYPTKLNITVIVDEQLIEFLNDWSNNLFYKKMDRISVNFLSIQLNDDKQIIPIGFSHMRPIFDNYKLKTFMDDQNGNWFDDLLEDEEFTFEFEGKIYPNSPHYEIIIDKFINVDQPEPIMEVSDMNQYNEEFEKAFMTKMYTEEALEIDTEENY